MKIHILTVLTAFILSTPTLGWPDQPGWDDGSNCTVHAEGPDTDTDNIVAAVNQCGNGGAIYLPDAN